MTGDARTLQAYADKAADYEAFAASESEDPVLARFIASVPAGGRVLDLGCGPGVQAALMQKAGLIVDAIDGCKEMVRRAIARGVSARLADFDAPFPSPPYDGIWASFSLLHAPRADMAPHLSRFHAALRPNGALSLSLKTGAGEKRDRLGRLYTYYGADEICELVKSAGFSVTGRLEGRDKGLAGNVEPWIAVTAHA